jgi:DNA repair photolyase
MNQPDLFGKTGAETQLLKPGAFGSKITFTPPRSSMNGKPVFEIPAKTVINFKSKFGEKLLCDGLTFSTGTACAYTCEFCYVPDMMDKQKPYLETHGITAPHEDIVIRRAGAIARLCCELTDRHGRPKYWARDDRRVIYSSPLVDVAANMELVHETIKACQVILKLTNWQIRLLSKSNLLPKIAEQLSTHRDRMIYGVSTGTLDDDLARVFEKGTPLVSKRIASLHWLQDNGFRTFGMICPSLPQEDYNDFAEWMRYSIRADRCEHVWAEVLNVRGDSMTRTINALAAGGSHMEARMLSETRDRDVWEKYARDTFLAHAHAYSGSPGKLRFLQYVTPRTIDWWRGYECDGAILL